MKQHRQGPFENMQREIRNGEKGSNKRHSINTFHMAANALIIYPRTV